MTAARPGASREPLDGTMPEEGKGAMDHVIDALATGLGNSIGWMAEHGVLFVVFAVLWVGFIGALVLSQGSLDQTWAAITSWPWPIQVVAWVLFLPVIGGLWLWETSWPLLVRIAGVLGLAWFNLIVLIPRAAPAAQP
jgi:hypothetical protein